MPPLNPSSFSPKSPALVITRFPYEAAWGGEESHTLALAREFRDQGVQVIFVGNCPVLLEKFQAEAFPVKKVEGGKMIVTPKELIRSFFLFPLWGGRMRRALNTLSKQYDLKALYCLSLNEKLFLTPLALELGVPVTWVEHQEIRDWLLKSPWKALYRRLARQVKIVPISPKNKSILKKALEIPAKNIVEIVHGVALEEITRLPRTPQRGLIVAANRLIPKKGMRDILEAFHLLHQKEPTLRLRLIGEGEEKGLLLKRIDDLNLKEVVTLSPPLFKSEWHATLAQADVYVSASKDSNETFSLNTAEALAAGCKVVVTRCSGIAHYLDEGKEAFLAKPEDPQALAESLSLALRAPEALREQAQQAARKKFDIKRMLQEYKAVILRATPLG